MDYLEFYKKQKRKKTHVDIVNFTWGHLGQIDVRHLSKQINKYFKDKSSNEPLVKFQGNIFSLNLEVLAQQLLPHVENNIYGCPIFVDKIYIYRNIHWNRLMQSSWLWHYDNNPPTVLKIMVYLNNVLTMDDAPLMISSLIKQPTRLGSSKWASAPNNSRVTEEQLKDYAKQPIYGEQGKATIFYPNCVHKATVPAQDKYRDVLVLRVRPTDKYLEDYISPKYTTGFETTGVVPRNPMEMG